MLLLRNWTVKATLVAGVIFAMAEICSGALMGYYPLDETNDPSVGTTVLDFSGASRNGVMFSDAAPPVGAIEGIASANAALYGTAYNFSSASDRLNFVDINPFSGAITRDGALTYAAWIKPSATQLSAPTIIGTNGSAFDFRLAPSGSGWSLHLKSGNAAPSLISAATVATDVWTHVAITKDANGSAGTNLANVNFYINGSNVGSGTIGRAGSGTPARLFLATGNSVTQYYNGGLDEVRIYNEVLDGATIAGLAAVPEPSSIFLASLGAMACVAVYFRRGRRG